MSSSKPKPYETYTFWEGIADKGNTLNRNHPVLKVEIDAPDDRTADRIFGLFSRAKPELFSSDEGSVVLKPGKRDASNPRPGEVRYHRTHKKQTTHQGTWQAPSER